MTRYTESIEGPIRKRIKEAHIARWRSGGRNTLVKVCPRGTIPSADRMAGYCTIIGAIIGLTPLNMERHLGLGLQTKLKNGADIFRVDPLPNVEQFENRAYTHLPAGKPVSPENLLNPDYPPGKAVLQWELTRYPQNLLRFRATVHPDEKFEFNCASLPTDVPVYVNAGG
jgi:hypothetical protein